jgi:lysophospholipase L1-like esterase
MEAMNVAADENATAQLNQLFGGEKYAYNIGTSGHTLMYCLKHLDSALDTYAPNEYVVIETRTLSFSDSELEAVLDGTLPDIASHNGGLTGLLQKLSYLRLLYTKYFNQSGDDTAQTTESGEQATTNTSELTQLLNRAAESCQAKGVQLIIVYDPVVYVDDKGVGYTDTQSGDLEAMESACAESGAWLVDLTDSYLEGYNTQHKLPYGFANTSPGSGHMNSWGHKLFAQAVYEAVKEGEA